MECDASRANFRFYSVTYVGDQIQAPTPIVESRSLWNFCNVLKTRSFVACAVEINLAWNLTEMERLTLYYDSVEELLRLGCFQCLFFASSRSHFRIEFVGFFSFLQEETQKGIDRLKDFRSRWKARRQ